MCKLNMMDIWWIDKEILIVEVIYIWWVVNFFWWVFEEVINNILCLGCFRFDDGGEISLYEFYIKMLYM